LLGTAATDSWKALQVPETDSSVCVYGTPGLKRLEWRGLTKVKVAVKKSPKPVRF
jgi:hypothetical protein